MTDENNNHNKQLSPATVEKFLTVQEKEIRLREKELELAAQSIANSHEYSLKALDANVNDRADSRSKDATKDKARISLIKIIIIGFLAMFVIAIWKDKDQIVMEVLRYLAVFASGLFVGGWATKPKKNDGQDNNE